MILMRPTWRINVDFPPILGPVTITSLAELFVEESVYNVIYDHKLV